MEPLDTAFAKFTAFVDAIVPGYWDTLVSEADARMKLIDPIFVDILGWPMADIHLEESDDIGRIDYRFTIQELSRLIAEAKREGRDLGINETHAARFFKLNGSVFATEAAQEAIKQLINYCAYQGAELACATNGRQWFVFRGNRLGDGKNVMDGTACAFGSLETIKTKFQVFYDLLAYEAVAEHRYRAIFHEAEGQPIRTTTFRTPVRRPETRCYLAADQISKDLDRIMLSFFQDLSGQDDPEARRACFVTTNESEAAEQNLARISEELRNQVRSLSTTNAAEITEAIKRVKEMQKQELILLVGTKGAGKSTFVERFFADVLPVSVATDCVIVRVDLASCGCDAESIIKWLDVHFLEIAESAAFADREHRCPDYDDLQGMFWHEYDRWRTGHAKHLYERDKEQFKIEFGQHIERIRQERPHDYIVHLLHRIALGFSKVPCLVFDNADHFDVPFQEAVFKYAYSLYSRCLCLAVVPITDTTSWQLSKQGAMQSFYSDAYFLPTPPTEHVLRKRIEFIEKKVADEKPEAGTGYFLGRGIRLEVDNIRAFTACLQKLFLSAGQVSEWIGNLANHDVRRSLQLTREIVSAPHIQVADLLKAFVAKSTLDVSVDDIKLAIIRGKYDIYPTGASSFVQNVFDLVTELDTSPLVGIRLLQFLKGAYERNPDGDSRYVSAREIDEYFHEIGIEPRATSSCLQGMLRTGLILDYDPSAVAVQSTSRLQISPSGRQHLRWALTDWVYLESMASVTPLLDQGVFEEVKPLLEEPRADRLRQAISRFVRYLLSEDSHFVLVPHHAVYEDQSRIASALEEQLEALKRFPTEGLPGRYARTCGRVTKWDRERGFGFLRHGDGTKDLFLHIKDVISPKRDFLVEGDCIEFDIAQGDKGPKAVNAIEIPND